MRWIQNYQLFLFDFDGILVNTEEIHYLAYKKMCQERGFSLDWDWPTYIRHAMFSSTGIKEGIYREIPALYKLEPSWDILYQDKKRIYFECLEKEKVELMPGVAELLSALAEKGIKRCVVTHSPSEQIALIRSRHPILDSIPTWITREHYTQAKPSPECYKKAIEMHGREGRIIGFEDSPRGLAALLGAEAEGVFISTLFEPAEIEKLEQDLGKKFSHCSSFLELAGIMDANQK